MDARLSKARATLFGCSALFAVELYLAQARWSRLETLLGAEKLALQIDRDGAAIRALSVDSRKSSAAAGLAKDPVKVVRQSIFVGHVLTARQEAQARFELARAEILSQKQKLD